MPLNKNYVYFKSLNINRDIFRVLSADSVNNSFGSIGG